MIYFRHTFCLIIIWLGLFNGMISLDHTNVPAPDISNDVWSLAEQAYNNAIKYGDVMPGLLTLIDYSKPSNEKRLWVVDMEHHKLLFHTYVSHGKNTGLLHARYFSNRIGSHQSSLGVYATQESYTGIHGYAMRLKGLEKGINDQANKRAIVMHSQWYVKDPYPSNGFQTGRSWGCPVISATLVKPIINTIKGGSFLMMYYPNTNWLHHSHYLTA